MSIGHLPDTWKGLPVVKYNNRLEDLVSLMPVLLMKSPSLFYDKVMELHNPDSFLLTDIRYLGPIQVPGGLLMRDYCAVKIFCHCDHNRIRKVFARSTSISKIRVCVRDVFNNFLDWGRAQCANIFLACFDPPEKAIVYLLKLKKNRIRDCGPL